MTIVCTTLLELSDRLIVMAVDSAVTLDFQDHREYETGAKAFFYDGVGCVATWGARDGNNVARFIKEQGISSNSHSVDDLANLVHRYLTEEYQPHKFDTGEVGYHVAGFDREGHARRYHIFWGFDRPKPAGQIAPKYEKYDHSHGGRFLFNGRNDLAETVIKTLLEQIEAGSDVRYDLTTPMGLAQFSEFVARFAAELTPEVGPPFWTYLISPRNKIQQIKNDSFGPTADEVFLEKLRSLGF